MTVEQRTKMKEIYLKKKKTKYTTCSMSTHNQNMSCNSYCFILLQDDLQNVIFLTSKQWSNSGAEHHNLFNLQSYTSTNLIICTTFMERKLTCLWNFTVYTVEKVSP